MRKLGLLVGLAFLVVLPLSSCGSSAEINLDGTAWELTSMGGAPLVPGSRITMAFEGGEVDGSAGCNHYFGTYTLSGGGGFQFSDWAISEMGCLTPEGVMGQETTYMSYLSTACRVVLGGDELKLQDGSGRDLLIFTTALE
jgi:heat shock protein HslJ